MAYIPGSGIKKPLNQLEMPVYPDIKAQLPSFKSSGKHWTVDVGNTLLSTEANTSIYDGAILAKSYRDNIDGYGQSSHQEKITVFRPPLRSHYEDIGPLNRLPTKINAIVPRINPGTTADGGGTSAFRVNNQTQQDIAKYISDRITSESWQQTFFMPLDMPLDNSILPNLETTLPSYSLSSGFESGLTVDAPRDIYYDNRALNEYRLHAYAVAGHQSNYNTPMHEQNENLENLELYDNRPKYSAFSGHTPQTTIDGDFGLNDISLDTNLPLYSTSSGYQSQHTFDGETQHNKMSLDKTLPIYSSSAGYSTQHTMNGETRFEDLHLDSRIESKLSVINPSSESGYKSNVEFYTPPEDHLKLRENPRVPVVAHSTFDYHDSDNIKSRTPQFQQKKIVPIKQYGNGLNSGTIKNYGVEEQKVGGRFLRSINKNKNR
jgi:hypothetical protein